MRRNAVEKTLLKWYDLDGKWAQLRVETITNPSVDPVTVSQRTSSECQMRGLLKYGLRMQPKREGGRRLLGSFVHEGIDAINRRSQEIFAAAQYSDGFTDDDIVSMIVAAGSAVDALAAAHRAKIRSDGLFDPNADTTLSEIDDSSAFAKNICNRYVGHWYSDRMRDDDASPHNLIPVASEITLTIRIHDANGNPTRYTHTGKLDRVFFDIGANCFVLSDTKTSSIALSEWRRSHEYTPQLWSYAVMFWRATGQVPRYFVDDMISTQSRPLELHELPRNQDGSLSKSAGLPRCLSSTWQDAINEQIALVDKRNAEIDEANKTAKSPKPHIEVKEWYFDALRELKHAESEGRWFMRVVRGISAEELRRAEAEMLADAKKAEKQRKRIKRVCAEMEIETPKTANQIARVVEMIPIAERMRSTSLCHSFGRPCDYLEFCRKPCASTAELFDVSSTAHVELATTTEDAE